MRSVCCLAPCLASCLPVGTHVGSCLAPAPLSSATLANGPPLLCCNRQMCRHPTLHALLCCLCPTVSLVYKPPHLAAFQQHSTACFQVPALLSSMSFSVNSPITIFFFPEPWENCLFRPIDKITILVNSCATTVLVSSMAYIHT